MAKAKIVLAVLLICLFTGCGLQEEASDPIVGQWIYESGNYWYLILENGDAFQIGVNGIGEYITGVDVYEPDSYEVRKDGSYTPYYSWYKEDGEYYWKTIFGERVEAVHIDGDTLVFGNNVYEWYRVTGEDMIPLDEIYYSTFDKENMAYVQHPLDELIEK